MISYRTKPYTLFIYGILLFLFLFTIKFSFLPIGTIPIYALLGLPIFLLNLSKKICIIRIPKKILYLVLSYLILLIALFLSLIINNTFDFGLIIFFTKTPILVFFASWFLVYLAYKWHISLKQLFKLIVFLYFLQMIFVTISFFYTNLQIKVLSFIDMGTRLNKITKELIGFRAFGFGFGYDFGTALLTFALIICTYLYFVEEKNFVKYLLILIYSSFVGVFVARTMFIGIAFLIVFFFLFPTKFKERKIIAIIFFLVVFFVFMLLILTKVVNLQKYKTTIDWVLEVFSQSLSDKNAMTGSVNILVNKMLFYPGDKTILIGDGLFGADKYYGETDIGFMRLILYFGFLGLFCFFIYIYNINKSMFDKPDKQLLRVGAGFLIFQLLFLCKILFIFDSFYLLFICYYIYPYFNKARAISY